MEAHRSHVYQRLTSGPRALPHVVIATYAAALAAAVTLAWAFLPAGGATASLRRGPRPVPRLAVAARPHSDHP